MMNWSIQTSSIGEKPLIMSEYIFNDLGIFIKRELRMPMNHFLTATTGFRIGYEPIKGTNYRAVPYDRNAILWHKITNIVEEHNELIINGNKSDVISVVFDQENRDQVLTYIIEMIKKYPPVLIADKKAVAWMCWRDDDEWEEPYGTLSDMIQEELLVDRFIEPEILEDTILSEMPTFVMPKLSQEDVATSNQINSTQLEVHPKFCNMCGKSVHVDSHFCGHCGSPIKQ